MKLPTIRRSEPVLPTGGEVAAIVSVMAPRWRLVVRLLEATAMRVGELLQLTWSDVDSRNGRLRISRTRTKGRTSGQRFAQVPAVLMEQLEVLLPVEDCAPGRQVFPGMTEGALKNAMGRACKAAGIPHLHPHDLRHRRLSLWHGQGVPAVELSKRAGHSRPSISLDVYSHVIDPADDEWLPS